MYNAENWNVSGTTEDMEKLKLRFCRIKCELSFHVEILVNTRWPTMQKFTLELKSSPKTCFFDDMDKMMGVLWNIDLLIMTRCLNFMNFKDMKSWIGFDENSWLRSVSNNVSWSKDLYSREPPSFCPYRRKNTFLVNFWVPR